MVLYRMRLNLNGFVPNEVEFEWFVPNETISNAV